MNRNIFWSTVFVDELIRAGLREVCIAPGSRSTPLTLAFAARPEVRVTSHLDERSAAFFALGLGLATGRPAAVVCTSGTATANFYPAVIEAHESEVPLLVLTADRSHELRDSGANQTIDQVKLYGGHVLWSVDVAPPEQDPPAVLVRSLRTLADRAFARASGSPAGPVHLNFPFRKPLEPTPAPADRVTLAEDEAARAADAPYTRLMAAPRIATVEQVDWLVEVIRTSPRGLILCGPRLADSALPAAVLELARASGYPVVAEALSGLRFGRAEGVVRLTHYDTLKLDLQPEVVLRFGDVPTSAALQLAVDGWRPRAMVQIRESGRWADDTHRLTHQLQAQEASTCQAVAQALGESLAERAIGEWLCAVAAREARVAAALQSQLQTAELFDGAVIADVVDTLPAGAALFIGNSLTVRHADQYGQAPDKALAVYGNRGVAGIDGLVSTALGVAAATPDRPLTLVLGDLSLYHDLNGLLAVRRCGVPITIVVVNNDGGGIFRRLPIREFEPAFTDLFLTPHGLSFAAAAQLHGLTYAAPTTRADLRARLATALAARRPHLIEVKTDSATDLEVAKRIRNLAIADC